MKGLNLTVERVHARQILDSRAHPTLEVEVWTASGVMGRAAVPAGASKGAYEALELRDNNLNYYGGKSVHRAIEHIHTVIQPALQGKLVVNQKEIDDLLNQLDGTPNKAKLGSNTILGVSMAVAKAAAQSLDMPLFRYWGGTYAHIMPTPMINILNGGMHADNNLDIQEFMILPQSARSFSDALHMGVEIFYQLGYILQAKGLSTALGDEGGFAPFLESHEAAIEIILQAIEKAGYRPGEDVALAVDAAASDWYHAKSGCYVLPKAKGAPLDPEEMVAFWQKWVEKYPIVSIEDGMADNDWSGWQKLTALLGNRVQLVGDDLFVTQLNRLQYGMDRKVGNAILIKMNQVGTVSETLATIALAQKHGYRTIVSHRSGETEDTIIADLAVAVHAGQIKTGSVARAERTAKYNQLLRIEEQLGRCAEFFGEIF